MFVRHPRRIPLVALGILALLAGMWGGLLRLGWPVPMQPALAIAHGPLMVSGFVGTLIGLERAVALGHLWGYTAPVLTGLGGLSLMAGLPNLAGPVLISAGSLVLAAIFVAIILRKPGLDTVTMGLGAICWLTANGLWLAGWPVPHVVFWWVGFLALTIAGERLELARLQHLSEVSRGAFVGIVLLLMGGLALSLVERRFGVGLAGIGLLALALWLEKHDIARQTVRQTGVTRFVAFCLLAGCVWLALSGVLAVLVGVLEAGPAYDATLHAFFLGFVFSMIFGHAPFIFPAILGGTVTYRPRFYAPLVLLHATLLLRISGDLLSWPAGREVGGLLNVLTLLIFLANTVSALLTRPAAAHSTT